MPQVVACGKCRQQFEAADFLAGTTVGCPTCGTPLAIPRPAFAARPVASVAASNSATAAPAGLGAHIDDLARHLPPQFRRRDKAVGLALLVIAAALWLLLTLPSLGLLMHGLHGPHVQILVRIGWLSVVFWIGMLIVGSGLLEWSFFMNSYKMQVTREWFGDQGARWFLVAVGTFPTCAALGMLALPRVKGLAAQAQHAVAGPVVPRPRLTPPAPPRGAIEQGQSAFAAESPSAPTAPALPAKGASPAPVLTTEDEALARDDAQLPGSWRRLEGGLGIKIPASLHLEKESVVRHGQRSRQEIHGRTVAGKDGIVFAVVVEHEPGKDFPDLAKLVTESPVHARHQRGEVVAINGLRLHKSDQVASATETYNADTYQHRGIRHQYGGPGILVVIDVRSRFDPDHPQVTQLVKYIQTLQPLPPSSKPPPGTIGDGTWDGRWRPLPGGLCMLIPAALQIEEDSLEQPSVNPGQAKQTIRGKTASGAEFRITAEYTPGQNFPNSFRNMKSSHIRDMRNSDGEKVDFEPVSIHGMWFLRIGKVGGGQADVDYQFREGPRGITMAVKSAGAANDPEFQSLLSYAETIQRAPGK
jgi:hypothetical protein